MNGVKEEFTIKMKQTSKGIWFCDGLQITAEHVSQLVGELDWVMIQVEGILYKHNLEESADKDPMTKQQVTEKWEQKIKNASGTGKAE